MRQAAASAALTQGIGAQASRLVGGSRTIHDVLEREIADFVGTEDAITLVSGYMTNASLIGHLLTKSDLIVVDDLCHNSIMVGAQDLARHRAALSNMAIWTIWKPLLAAHRHKPSAP